MKLSRDQMTPLACIKLHTGMLITVTDQEALHVLLQFSELAIDLFSACQRGSTWLLCRPAGESEYAVNDFCYKPHHIHCSFSR